MRITNSMMSRNLLGNVNSSRSNMNDYQTQIASGKKIEKVSDDPVNYTKIDKFNNEISENNQYLDGIVLAKGWIDHTSTALEQMNEGLLSARDIAIRASDVSNNQTMYKALKDQVDDIIEDTISLSNSTFMGKSLFAGTKTTELKSFLLNNNSITYAGNNKAINRKISDNYYVDINVNGHELVDTKTFENLISLKNALDTGNLNNITESIDKLDESSEQITKLNSSIGSVKIQMINTENRLNTANLNLKSYLSNVGDTDMAEAIANYKSEEMAYRAALSATSSTINLNILNFLR